MGALLGALGAAGAAGAGAGAAGTAAAAAPAAAGAAGAASAAAPLTASLIPAATAAPGVGTVLAPGITSGVGAAAPTFGQQIGQIGHQLMMNRFNKFSQSTLGRVVGQTPWGQKMQTSMPKMGGGSGTEGGQGNDIATLLTALFSQMRN